jgi:phosphocarrier protein FPr
MSDKLILHAPMNGVLIPIEKVPDPAFAEKMIGDGFSIDPTEGILRAPCDGTVIHIHKSIHAVTLQSECGLEILLHIGIDTVDLKGDGFTAEVQEGVKVKTGDPLISFDMHKVASTAPNLLTQVLIATMELVEKIEVIAPQEVQNGSEVCTIFCKSEDANATGNNIVSDSNSETGEVVIPNHLGLHARPAGVLANFAKTFAADIELLTASGKANAKSITSIMKLNTKLGDHVKIKVSGTDAKKILTELIKKIESGLGEDAEAISINSQVQPEEPKSDNLPEGCNEIKGIPASGGVSVGTAFILKEPTFTYEENASEPETELARLDIAVTKLKNEIEATIAELGSNNQEKSEIFAAHLEIIEDPEIRESSEKLIAQNKTAEFAWSTVCLKQAEELKEMKNELLAARALDLKDVSIRILGLLQNVDVSPEIPEGSIVITNELTPSLTAGMDPKKIRGFCTVTGGATSHVAILAKSLGIPAIVGMHPAILSIKNGSKIVLDAFKGTLNINLTNEEVAKFAELQAKLKKEKAEALATADKPATTIDGRSIEIAGNAGNASEVTTMVQNGGEGIGLMRSEFIFVNRVTPPNEEEQFEIYKKAIENAGTERRVIIRTLDVGGDKPLSYMPLPQEENPFLGERGIRVSLKYPDIFRTQLRALLRASEFGKLQIMFPMIGGLNDWREAKKILDEERNKLKIKPIPVGVMIEVPAAALMADKLAEEVDFFSIGTNDLTQYTIAIDRGHSTLAEKADALDPAVLKLIKMTVDAARKNNGWVGVCGALGDDPQALPILIGLGVDELSVSIPVIPTVKARVRTLTEKDCVNLAEQALKSANAAEVRSLVKT